MTRSKINAVPADAVHYASPGYHPCRFYRQRVIKHGIDPVTHSKPSTSIRLSKITCAQCLAWLRAHGSAWNAARAADHQDASERTIPLFEDHQP